MTRACIACRHAEGTWFAQLRYLLSYKAKNDRVLQCALVRYLREVEEERKDDARSKLGMPWLEWMEVAGPRGRRIPQVGWISFDSIQGPAYMQPDPKISHKFLYNKFIIESG